MDSAGLVVSKQVTVKPEPKPTPPDPTVPPTTGGVLRSFRRPPARQQRPASIVIRSKEEHHDERTAQTGCQTPALGAYRDSHDRRVVFLAFLGLFDPLLRTITKHDRERGIPKEGTAIVVDRHDPKLDDYERPIPASVTVRSAGQTLRHRKGLRIFANSTSTRPRISSIASAPAAASTSTASNRLPHPKKTQ